MKVYYQKVSLVLENNKQLIMISIDIMIFIFLIVIIIFGFLIYSEPKDEEAFQLLWDENDTSENVGYRGSNGEIITFDMLKGADGKVNFNKIGEVYATEVAQHFYKKAIEIKEKGSLEEALDLLQQAHQNAPKWPIPLYYLAVLYLEKGDIVYAYESFEDIDILVPEGYKDTKTALFTLKRELEGKLPKGFYQMYKSTKAISNGVKKLEQVQLLLEKQPDYAPLYLLYSLLHPNPDVRISAVQKGLQKNMDLETKGALLIQKATLDAEEGDEYEAIEVLGEMILSEATTISNYEKARFILKNVFEI